MSVTADERAGLADLFDEVGPDQPTLCGEWTTGDLVAHLIVRERRPDAAGGILVPALAKRTDKVMADVAAEPYRDLVQKFREGPPFWSPLGWPVIGDQANLFEFYVHHEDVRRAQPEWEPRPDAGGREDALWKSLKLGSRMLFRHSPVGVVLRSAGRDDVVARKRDSSVTLVGLPGEIALLGFGRAPDLARVVIEGAPADIDAFTSSKRGL
ncbi:MAG: hypothetical protein JWN39_3074 [Ilumatobacteraceae bacterium]|nr:hypothetical protein [Ilumatobacteraceae bacterium]